MAEIMDVDTEPVKMAQTAAPDTEPTDWMVLNDEFRNGAPDNVKDLITKKGYKNLGQFFDSYTEMEKFQGVGKHLVIPEAEDAEFANKMGDVYNQLGRPETHDKYEFSTESEIEISDELIGQFKQYAHSLGLTQKQFSDVVSFQLEAVAAQTQAYEAQIVAQQEENVVALKQKFGEANYNAKVTGARIIADSLGIYKILEAKGLASDPNIIMMLDTIANRTAEDVIAPSTPTATTKTPQERIDEIKKSEAFLKKFHPEHKEIMKEYMQLNQEVANSGQARQPRL